MLIHHIQGFGMNKCSRLIMLLFFMTSSIFSQQEKPIIAVLDFTVTDVSQSEMKSIIGLLSSALFRTGSFTVIDVSQRETVLRELQFSLSGCSDESCMLEVGKLLSAEAIVIGSIGRVGQKYVLSSKMLETETAMTLGTADGIYTTLDSLLSDIPGLAEDLAAPYLPSGGTAATRGARRSVGAANSSPSRTAGYITLGTGVACAGAGTYLLAVSLPAVMAYYDAKAAYEAAGIDQDVTALWNTMQEAWQEAMGGYTNTQFFFGVSLTSVGITLGVVSAFVLAAGGRGGETAAARAPNAPRAPASPDVSFLILPGPKATALSFRCRF